MLFFHGHQLDRLTRGRALISKAAVWTGGWLERIGLHMTPEDSRPLRNGKMAPWHETFATAAIMLGASRGADVIVTGHTHNAVRIEENDRLFMNSGTCVAGRHEMVLLDTTASKYEVVVEPGLQETTA
jgi:UDP-2,3-diacylglucosamine pyrophosphatase LpxH